MRKLLIADDERNIRQGLKAMIERGFPGVYRIAMAADGRQAMEAFEREPADIVLTDIRMPELDGIAFIKQLAEKPRVPAMLILSGYDDFQYAKEAIRHNVKDYLLKPIVRDDLFAALSRIEAELSQQDSLRGKLEETDRYREAMRLHALNYMLATPDIGEDEVHARCIEAGLQEFEPSFFVGVMDPLNHQRILIKGREILSDLEQDGTWLAWEDRGERLVVLAKRPEPFVSMTEQLASWAGAAGTFAAGLSEEGSRIGQLRAKYGEARQALKYRLLLGRSDSVLLRFSSVKNRGAYPVPEDKIRKLANMVGTDRDKEMKSLLLELFEPGAFAEADIGYFEAVSRALNEQVFDQVFRTYGEASVEILKLYRLAGSIYNFSSIHDFIHCAEGLLSGLSEYVRDLKSAHVDQKEMARAVAYIHANFDKDLSMTMVSNHVSLNYSYFSERFKEYTGESFVNYLKKLRIGKAKELLAETDARIHEISRRVGFENPKQFNRVFRETEGITPMEFRQKI